MNTTLKLKWLNLPNFLTIFRIFLSGIFLFFIFNKDLISKVISLVIFSVATLTDFYDGYLARKLSQVTDFGKFLDPIADKILIFSCFLAFLQMQILKAWMVLIIFSREILITFLRILALSKGKVIQANLLGKHKMVSQVVAIYIILIFLIFKELPYRFKFYNLNIESLFRLVINSVMGVVIILTIISGLSYLWKNKLLFKD
ncbi:CDP-diacylglycerol--glycerol-3-phosphate 3-phosphatidyltransferase [Candidatus Woesearchaeota archaeon]|nr:MAG: CDP-diacylglycerol--glycerol-3-phosphate 3-phosphatidyltransferase [Candidatus Woesearchaeota archaeon]